MAYIKPTASELKFAYRLLLYLHANTSNPYLLLAVVAWVRQESGTRWIGNNPLNIRNSSFASGYRQTTSNGHFAIFSSLDAAARASAAFLTGNHGNGYELVIKVARRQGPSSDYAPQGADFLIALAMSKWDAGHYGTAIYGMDGPKGDEHRVIVGYDQSKNHLIKVWQMLLGHKITLPPDAAPQPPKQPPPPPPKPKFRQERGLLHSAPRRLDYLTPYGAYKWYETRNGGAEVLTDE